MGGREQPVSSQQAGSVMGEALLPATNIPPHCYLKKLYSLIFLLQPNLKQLTKINILATTTNIKMVGKIQSPGS